jgi:putative endonuclease
MQIFVYMLRCRDGSYYVGVTRAGLDKRVGEHASGVFTGYTHSRRPVELVWSGEFQRLTDAIAFERQLKGWRRDKKEALFRGEYSALIALSRTAKNPRR